MSRDKKIREVRKRNEMFMFKEEQKREKKK